MITVDEIKKELIGLAVTFAALTILFMIVYSKEDNAIVFRFVFGIFWLFTLPGAAILFGWRNELPISTRMLIGTILGMGITGIASYYLGLFGFLLGWQTYALPAAIVLGSLAFHYFWEQRTKTSSQSKLEVE